MNKVIQISTSAKITDKQMITIHRSISKILDGMYVSIKSREGLDEVLSP